MIKKISMVTLVVIAFMANSAFAANCITQKRGVNMTWHGNGGYFKFTKVHKMTKSFWVTVELNAKGNVFYSGIPSKGQKVSIPKGTEHVILNISNGQGEVCYSR